MTRRVFLSGAVPAPASPLHLTVYHVTDARAKQFARQFHRFFADIWPEVVRDFRRSSIEIQTIQIPGEIRRAPSGRPILTGLTRGVINMVLTDTIPLPWDYGRALAGVTTAYEGYHVCLIALRYAHSHQFPFLSVNTCVHELLHLILGDVFENRPEGLPGRERELRIDWYATHLWLLGGSATIRDATAGYLARLNAMPRE